MSKPWIHAESSAKRFGGVPADYIAIHNLLDSSKGAIADSRHRALTHTSWFLFILEQIFGVTITNSSGRVLSVRDIGEQHILEDFQGRFIPTPQDYLEGMECKEWMIAGKGEAPPSYQKLRKMKLSTLELYKEAQKKKRKAAEECRQQMKDAFKLGASKLFADHPTLQSFAWTQYTPYFADGDPCEFSANTDYLYIKYVPVLGDDEEEDEDWDDGEEEWYAENDVGPEAVTWRAILGLLNIFDEVDYQDAFGDHKKVTVTRAEGNTAKIKTSNYEHD